MCTVTYIPIKNGFILTSSRDERVLRPTAKPRAYLHANTVLVYPKDEIANGTWIAASNEKKAACLLNGGFENHEKKENYATSRGQILIQCFNYGSFDEAIKMLDLYNVEPFTLLLISYESEIEFTQLVWDGEQKHIESINTKVPAIWSSVSLYTKQDHALRIGWFDNWIFKNKSNKDHKIFDFHAMKHGNIDSKDILMKRDNDLQTVSISQINIKNQEENFIYYDLRDLKTTKLNLSKLRCIPV